MKLFSRTDRSVLGSWWWTVDRVMLAMFLALIVTGVMLVAAASPAVAERIGLTQYHFIIRHLIILGPAMVLMFGLSALNLQQIKRAAFIVLGAGVVLMA